MKKRIISIFIIFSMVVSFLNVLGSLYSVKAADEVVFKYSQVINPETQEASRVVIRWKEILIWSFRNLLMGFLSAASAVLKI